MMSKRLLMICLVMIAIIVTACGGEDDTTTKEPKPTNTEDASLSATFTPMSTADLPAIELLEGSANTCRIINGFSDLVGYRAIFYETTTETPTEIRLLDAEGNVLIHQTQQGENKDGAQGWGWYPPVYDVPDNSALTLELTVHLGVAEDAPATSVTTLTYNCTSGETIDTSFVRNP